MRHRTRSTGRLQPLSRFDPASSGGGGGGGGEPDPFDPTAVGGLVYLFEVSPDYVFQNNNGTAGTPSVVDGAVGTIVNRKSGSTNFFANNDNAFRGVFRQDGDYYYMDGNSIDFYFYPGNQSIAFTAASPLWFWFASTEPSAGTKQAMRYTQTTPTSAYNKIFTNSGNWWWQEHLNEGNQYSAGAALSTPAAVNVFKMAGANSARWQNGGTAVSTRALDEVTWNINSFRIGNGSNYPGRLYAMACVSSADGGGDDFGAYMASLCGATWTPFA